MIPVLFSIGKFSVSSFGILLVLSFLLGLFLIWRLGRAWDMDEEKLLDLSLLTLVGALIGARAFEIATHFSSFGIDPLKWALFYKYPGFSFIGAFLGGGLSLTLVTKKLKMDFWQICDIASVGLLGGLIVSNIGCFLGGCNIGIPSKFFLSYEMVGNIGKRLPVQLFEATLLLLVLFRVWSKATHFHKRGIILGMTFIFLGLINLVLTPLKVIKVENYFFSTTVLILGFVIVYKVTGRNILKDLKTILVNAKSFFTSPSFRKQLVSTFKKSWYNHKVSISWNMKKLGKLIRRLNVRYQHKESKFY